MHCNSVFCFLIFLDMLAHMLILLYNPKINENTLDNM